MSCHYKYLSIVFIPALVAFAGCSSSSDDNTAAAPAAQAPQSVSASHTVSVSDLNSATKSDNHCSLDAVNSTGLTDGVPSVPLSAAKNFTAGGWAVTNAMQSPPKFTLVFEGSADSYGFDGVTGVARPDVAKVTNSSGALQSGFNMTGSLNNFPAGTYKVLILVNGAKGNETCDTKRQVVIGA